MIANMITNNDSHELEEHQREVVNWRLHVDVVTRDFLACDTVLISCGGFGDFFPAAGGF
ncbi:hypothetical protein RchiOBHm_Chr6g0282281 [Rosa chinensis]|uniref:Uncharacterized protein n=1 Tax=Rosa chinensis TaxID=74649 RepID=A0A2P6PTR1_ROSCH|nr:hypothetical protein RchiOBHm_Chr6g0282281 [Rosa chinensis]